MPAIPPVEDEANTTYTRRTKAKAKHQPRSKWASKALHGKYPQRVKQADVDHNKTHRWLKSAGLKEETDGFIIAAQDQSPQHADTNKTSSRSLTWTQNVDCVACGRFEETIDHLVSGCPELAKTDYIHRHNKAAAHMHWKVCKECGIKVKERWYEHEPKRTVAENDSVCGACPSTLTGP